MKVAMVGCCSIFWAGYSNWLKKTGPIRKGRKAKWLREETPEEELKQSEILSFVYTKYQACHKCTLEPKWKSILLEGKRKC